MAVSDEAEAFLQGKPRLVLLVTFRARLRGCACLLLAPLQILPQRRGEPFLALLVLFSHVSQMRQLPSVCKAG